ncbi:hypothetical protein SNS2_0401 [Streptomyces netropsis]|nr:hypothetical protein SNS2_0401 [Streptomyces netropsis]
MPGMPRTPRSRSLRWADVAAWRLRRHHLLDPLTAPEPWQAVKDVSAALCGLHAQVMSSAEQAVAARTRLPDTDAAVREALWERRALVKTWAMRGTLHLLPAHELPLYVAALRDDRRQTGDRLLAQQGLTPDDVAIVLEALPAALGEDRLTREALAERLTDVTHDKAIGDKVRSGWGVLLKPAARRGLLCFGPNDGRNVTFCAPRYWLGTDAERAERSAPTDPAQALGAVLRRYLHAYGPASPDDFARWWGTGTPEVRAALSALGDAVMATDIEGHRSWALRDDVAGMTLTPAGDGPLVRLLPAFDPYIVGLSRQLASLLPDPALRSKVSRTAGWISPVLILDGMIGGVWKAQRRVRHTEVEIEAFVPLGSGVRRRIAEEAEGLLAPGDGHGLTVRFA